MKGACFSKSGIFYVYNSDRPLFLVNQNIINLLRLFSYFLLAFIFASCMKYRCYECKNNAGDVVHKACDKKAAEINEHAQANNLSCTILPD
jgi:hypothetical protein